MAEIARSPDKSLNHDQIGGELQLSPLLKINFEKFQSAQKLLQDTLSHLHTLTPEILNDSRKMEPYDALSSRFERCVEMGINRFFRSLELELQGQSSATVRDRLLFCTKIGITSSVEIWLEMREFRNKIAHDYLPEQLLQIYESIRNRFAAELSACVERAHLKMRELNVSTGSD